jgi:hypothetical protein
VAAINVAKKLCATQKQILWHTTFLIAIYRSTMSKYETLEEQMFGSSDDDWDDTQTTQETSQLTCDSPLSSGQTGGKGERTVAVRDFIAISL